jgi:hypothetical protein
MPAAKLTLSQYYQALKVFLKAANDGVYFPSAPSFFVGRDQKQVDAFLAWCQQNNDIVWGLPQFSSVISPPGQGQCPAMKSRTLTEQAESLERRLRHRQISREDAQAELKRLKEEAERTHEKLDEWLHSLNDMLLQIQAFDAGIKDALDEAQNKPSRPGSLGPIPIPVR